MTHDSNPYVFGTPGGSLALGAAFSRSRGAAAAGRAGELATAAVLNPLAEPGLVVFHDLDVPMRRRRDNLDHVVVIGDRVTVIDSKQWLTGWYWTDRRTGRTRRATRNHPGLLLVGGGETFTPGDLAGIDTGRHALERYLAAHAPHVEVTASLAVIWPSGPGAIHLSGYHPVTNQAYACRPVPGHRFRRDPVAYLGPSARPGASANEAALAALIRLVR